MAEPWSSLVPLVVGSALVPVQLVVTILLLRSPGGARTGAAWVAGMTTTRLAQGVLFGVVLSSTDAAGDADTSTIASTLLVVIAVLFLVGALRKLIAGGDDDADAPPPRWLQATASMTAVKAYLVGAGLLVIAPKFWVFTLGAITAIGDADIGRTASVVTFLAFAVLAVATHLVLIGLTALAPRRAEAVLDASSAWLTRNDRVIMITVGLVFGTWFLVKGLDGLGVI